MNISVLTADSRFKAINDHNPDAAINGIFACDMLSHVMGHAAEGNVLVTVLSNINVLGVASLLDLPAVVFPHKIVPNEVVIAKANELGIALFTTTLTTAETVILLHELGA